MTNTTKTLAYYITPHGFGHAVRSLEIIRQLLELAPELRILIVSDLPDFLVEQNVGRRLPMRRKRLDVGLVQQDSIRFDLQATFQAVEQLYRHRDALIAEEVRFLREENIAGLVADIPFMSLYAASECGIPALGVSNFTWDWIYQAYAQQDPRWRPLIQWIRDGYQRCDLLHRLPMHGDCSACPRIIDVPLVARHPTKTRDQARQRLGCPPDRKAYLISFTALDIVRPALHRLEQIEDVIFYYRRPLKLDFKNGRSLDEVDCSYADIIAAMDGVITKPGYGIVSDCLVQGTPIIYTDRGVFPEYEILVSAMNRHLNTVYLSRQELYEGLWDTPIRQLESMPRRSSLVRSDGARVCAGSIIKHLSPQAKVFEPSGS